MFLKGSQYSWQLVTFCHIFTEEQEQNNEHTRPTLHIDHCQKIAVVDGMVIVQKQSAKVSSVETVKQVSACFLNLTKDFDEFHCIVFDILRFTHLLLLLIAR